ncbi:homeodomain-interacting protein kinase 1-like [Acanthochromis polyacanthus]|uniref:homeodomain-interacting protein kinase 1-like n=1 Tax=Acanthochromis polyacanthus TaxID=80966 RepID=UPI002234BB98|nr:homeodomain-interacting protein kinase 1-like [Acanthochromis polyacanthus]XP_051805841.1 homeodomain-interacting protein kinase 1-like [Acanthochromis polyacanthus]XP_051805842.1 homeodomain-interacting protein kinase 1-like [Acanthochromis polyacanthus]
MNIQRSSSPSSSDGRTKVPKGYTLAKNLGHGSYGTVLECVEDSTEEHVAIKMPEKNNLDREAEILEKLMSHNSDESNIIKYKGEVFVKSTRLLVLEKLDITLWDYVHGLRGPMQLEHVRTVIQQLAVALNTTKSAGIIHTDVKMDNIMMVDRVKQPFKVKLIDFGLAKYRSEAKAGDLVQILRYRAPEIILGLPYSEAIDVWSLGCVMARMVARIALFGTHSEYWILRQMISLLGPPPQHLIEAGPRSRLFFKKISGGVWRLKTPGEHFGILAMYAIPTHHRFGSLDEMKRVYSEPDNPAEADERRECIELLKAMVQWDEKDRITPSGILNHPFITKSYLNSSSPISSCDEPKPSTSVFIMVKPADPENRTDLTGLPDEDKDREHKKSSKDEHSEESDDSKAAKDIEDGENGDTSNVSKDDQFRKVEQNHQYTEDSEKEQSKKKKKKKNCFQRILSRMKKTFCCCCVSDVMD